jgi:predicted transcriptional regulator
MQGNVYDASGIQADQSVMAIGSKAGTRNAGKSTGDGRSEDSTLWWDVAGLTPGELTDWVLTSDTGSGIPMSLEVPDADTDRANDVSTFSGSLGACA